VLFSTETFSMGVNMPAKTVVFTSIKKWDGQEFRWINSGEYIQMSGRAGRRGLDDRGFTILMFDEQVEPETAKGMFTGQALRLDSQFHLGYNMLLNLMRVEGADPEYMIQRSFYQFQRDKRALGIQELCKKLKEEAEGMEDIVPLIEMPEGVALPDIDVNRSVAEYHKLTERQNALRETYRSIVMLPENISRYMQTGRMVHVVDQDGVDWGWGIVAGAVRRPHKTAAAAARDSSGSSNHQQQQQQSSSGEFIVDVLLECDLRSTQTVSAVRKPTPARAGQERVVEVMPVSDSCIHGVAKMRANLGDINYKEASGRAHAKITMEKIRERFDGSPPLLDPISEMGLDGITLQPTIDKLKQCESDIASHPLHNHPLLDKLLDKYRERLDREEQVRGLETELAGHRYLVMKDDLRAMRKVLKRLQYVDKDGVVTLKGRVACEITTTEELVVTELLFRNTFQTMEADHMVATLSALCFDEKIEDHVDLHPELAKGFDQIKEVAKMTAEVSAESKLPIKVDEYLEKFKPNLMPVVLRWMRGESFKDVIDGTGLFEGSVIRGMRRLEELLRQLAAASKAIGNDEMEAKMREGVTKLRRGIVFAASLYL